MRKVFLLLLVCIPQFATAQKVWTLQECVEYAVENNLQVRQSAINSEISGNEQKNRLFNMFPSLNASGSYNHNYGRSVDPFTNDFTTQTIKSGSFSLSSSVTLFNGFQLQNELKKSKLDYMASRYDLEKITDDVSLNVAAAYLQVLYNKEQLTAAEDRVGASTQMRDRTGRLVESGVLAEGSLLDAESQLAGDELGRVEALNALNISVLTLAQLLELENASGLQVEAPRAEIPDQGALALTPNEIYDMAYDQKPEIKSADYKVQSAEKSVDIAKGGMFPRLTAFGSLGSGYSNQTLQPDGDPYFTGPLPTGAYTQSGETVLSDVTLYNFTQTPFTDQVDNNLNQSVGLSLSIPIFNGFSNQTNIKRAKLLYAHTKYSSDITRKELLKSIQQAHADAVAALNRFTAAEKNQAAMKESFRYTERKYDAGLLNSVDYITIKNNLTKAESDLLQAKYDFIFRLKVLDFYMGKPLAY